MVPPPGRGGGGANHVSGGALCRKRRRSSGQYDKTPLDKTAVYLIPQKKPIFPNFAYIACERRKTPDEVRRHRDFLLRSCFRPSGVDVPLERSVRCLL